MIRLHELFDIHYGNQFDLSKMEILSGVDEGVDFICRSSQNNGFIAKVAPFKETEPFEPGLITVTLGGTYLLSSFVQPRPFYTAQNIKILRPKINLSIEEKLYYCAAIEKNRFRYHSHGREANVTFDGIPVPAPKDIPQYIKKYTMMSPFQKKPLTGPKVVLETQKWKWFSLSELFDIVTSKDSNFISSEQGDVPYVSSSQLNNGVSGFVNEEPSHSANTLTIARNGSVASTFYQPVEYCASPDDVRILCPKFKMNQYSGLFLAVIIEKEKYRYDYGRKFGTKRMKETLIKLPVKPDGSPDWQFMEQYIKSLPYSGNL